MRGENFGRGKGGERGGRERTGEGFFGEGEGIVFSPEREVLFVGEHQYGWRRREGKREEGRTACSFRKTLKIPSSFTTG